jgi:pyrimidine deaminase RibD-like protein
MEPIEDRSDFRVKFIAAGPAQVFAAMRDPARVRQVVGASRLHELHTQVRIQAWWQLDPYDARTRRN